MSKVINLTDRQKVFLDEIPEWMHETAIAVWNDYQQRKTWNNAMERSKAEYAFYMGFQTCSTMSTPKSPTFSEETFTLPPSE